MKNKRICVRLGEEEYQLLMEKSSRELGDDISKCVRRLIQLEVPSVNPGIQGQLCGLRNDLAKIGTNINQIAKNNNSHLYNKEDKEKLFWELGKMENFYERLLLEIQEISSSILGQPTKG